MNIEIFFSIFYLAKVKELVKSFEGNVLPEDGGETISSLTESESEKGEKGKPIFITTSTECPLYDWCF